MSNPYGPLIVHISGSSGSGKSNLGSQLQRKFPDIAVKYTDEFYEHTTYDGRYLHEYERTPARYLEAWQSARHEEISTFVEAHHDAPVIVFVGLLDHRAPVDIAPPIDMPQADAKYFIDISDVDLLRQYYTRTCEHFSRGGCEMWQKLASGELHIASSTEKVDENALDETRHREAGYLIESVSKIRLFIEILRSAAKGSLKRVSGSKRLTVHLARGEAFLYTWSTSAIWSVSLEYSRPLKEIARFAAAVVDSVPGSSNAHHSVFVVETDSRGVVELLERVTHPTGAPAQEYTTVIHVE